MLNDANNSYLPRSCPLSSHVSCVLPPQIVSDEIKDGVLWLVTGICPPIAVFGVVANIINIICFVKQGFRDPVNISFVGMGN